MLSLGNKLSLTTQPIYKFVNKYSIDFDGVDDRIITDSEVVQYEHATYSFWAKSSETGSNRGVFGHGNTFYGAFHFNFDGTRPLLYLNGGNYIYWNDNSAQDDGEWHHWVVYVCQSDSSKSKLWVDGVLQTTSQVVTTEDPAAYAETLTIGSDRQVGGNSFEGKIDEFAVYDRELTQAEITRMYNTYYSPNRVANGNFAQIGNEEVTNGDFSQIGSEEVTGFTNGTTYPFTTFTTSGNNITSAIVSSAFAGAVSNAISVTSGSTYKVTFDYTKNSGDDLRVVFSSVVSGAGTQISNSELISASGSYTKYFTITSTTTGYLQMGTGNSGHSLNASITNVSVKEVGQDWIAKDGVITSVENGKLLFDNSSGNANGGAFQNIGLVTGKQYKMTATMQLITGSSNGTFNLFTSSATGTGQSSVYTGSTLVVGGAAVTETFTFTPGSGDVSIQFTCGEANATYTISDISVKEVGQHWTFGTGWSTDGTKALSDGSSGNLDASITALAGKTYKVTYTILDYVSGDTRFRFTGTSNENGTLRSANGTYVEIITLTNSQSIFRMIGSGVYSIDNIVVQELKHDATNLMLNAGAYQSANPLITSTKSMEFDGTDDYLEVQDDSSLQLEGSEASWTFWTRLDSLSGGDQKFIAKATTTGGANAGYQIRTDNADLLFQFFSGAWRTVTSSSFFTDLNWVNVTITIDASNIVRIYKNGVETLNSNIGYSIPANTGEMLFGARTPSSPTNFLNGEMTEVGIWNRELTSLEVASLYNQGMPTDLLVNRNNYQSGNPTVFNTKQVDFDGVDDYLVAESPTISTEFTVSAWINTSDSSGEGAGGSFRSFFSTGTYTSGTTWKIGLKSGGEVEIWQAGASRGASTTNVADGNWHFVTYTKNSTEGKIYVDGVLESTSAYTTTLTFPYIYIGIGGTNSPTPDNGGHYNGKISQIGLWNEVLTADEVSSLYNHGLPIDLTTDQAAYSSSSNLVGYWRMGSGTLDTYPLIADQTNATLSSELITNGDFATDSNWIKGTGWSIANGKATHAGGSSNTYLEQQNVTITGKIYKAVFTVSGGLNATNYIQVYGQNKYGEGFAGYTSAGTYTLYFTADATFFRFRAVSPDNDVSVDNVSLKQVQGNPAIMTNQTSSDIENGSPYANLVQNGTFDTDSNWTKGTGWTIANGKASSAGSNAYQSVYQTGVLDNPVNKTYKTTFTVSDYVSGSLKLNIGGYAVGAAVSANGTYTQTLTATNASSNSYVYFESQSSPFVGSIDNVTVEEVNTGLQGYWKMGDGTNDEYPVIYDQVDTTTEAITVRTPSTQTYTENNVTRVNDDSANSVSFTSTSASSSYALGYMSNSGLLETVGNFAVGIYKLSFTLSTNSTVFGNNMSMKWYNTGSSYTETSVVLGENTIYGIINTANNNSHLSLSSSAIGQNIILSNITVDKLNGNGAFMTNMVEGNITNQYPLTKIRNYYRMGDGILDVYPLIADQTNPSLGSEILSQPVDLQTDFVANSGGVIVDADTFTTAGGTFDGIKKSGFLTIGKTYKLTIDGNTTSSGFTIGYLVSGNEYGSGFGTHYFTATTSDLWIRQSTSGTTNITSFTIKQVNGNPGIMTNMSASDIILDTPNEPN